MTLFELVKHLRETILDDTGGTGISWEDIVETDDAVSLLRWSNEELTRLINAAQIQACRSAFLLKNSTLSIDVVADQPLYYIDKSIIKIKNAFLDSTGNELRKVEIEDLYSVPRWKNVAGLPNRYIVDYATGVLRLYPIPVDDDTISLISYVLPQTTMDWSTKEIDEPEIKEQFQLDMLYYAAYLAYQKENANTFDPNRSEKFKLLFESQFSNTSAYGDTRRERTRNRPIRYGGY